MARGERVLGSTWGRSGSAGGGWVPRHTRRAVASRVERWLWVSPPNAPQARVHARAAAGLSSCHAPVHCCVSPGSSCPCCLLLWSGRPAAARYRRRAAGAAAGVGARVVPVAGPFTIPGKSSSRQCCCDNAAAEGAGTASDSTQWLPQMQRLPVATEKRLAWPGRRSWAPPGIRMPFTACGLVEQTLMGGVKDGVTEGGL